MSSEIRPLRALAHPAFFAGLFLLVLNDHVLKGAGVLPGWLTGKLSDFAGVFVAAVLFSALVRARTKRGVITAHAAVGIGFALVKTSAAAVAIASAIYRSAGVHWITRIDPTDLMALAVLPLGAWFTVRIGGLATSRARSLTASALAPLAVLACAASTGNRQYSEQQLPTSAPVCDPGSKGSGGGYYGSTGYYPYYNGSSTAACPANQGFCDNNGFTDCENPACALACSSIDRVCAASAMDSTSVTALDGDTTHGSNVSAGSCVGADAPEVIYQLSSQKAGTLTFGVPANHGLYVRTKCIDDGSEIACNDGSKPGGTVTASIAPGDVLTVVVDAIDPLHPGPFHVPVTFVATGCGDGVREDPEQCDDGAKNGTPGDGCSSNCTALTSVLCQTFPTAQLGQTPGDFTHATRSFFGPCVGTYDTPEQGYRYLPKSSSVTVSVASSAKIGIYGRSGACPGTTSLGCIAGGALTTSLKMATQPGQEMTFFVELAPGASPSATYTLTVSEP